MKGRLFALALLLLACSDGSEARLVCYYNALGAHARHMTIESLVPALQFCNYLVYGYAGIDPSNYHIRSLHDDPTFAESDYRAAIALKRHHPHLRVLLSLGGDADVDADAAADREAPNKYLLLLEEAERRQAFVRSAMDVIQRYGFDGLDLAWQFPKNPPKVESGSLKRAWGKFKGWFTGPPQLDAHADEHRQQFTALMRELRRVLPLDSYTLSFTLLPHVDPALFVDAFTVTANVDFVNLASFDFRTAARSPKVADHTAPLYEMFERDPSHSVNGQVQHWLNSSIAASTLNIGVPSYGRTWQMTADSGITGYPPLPDTAGPAPGGPVTATPGLLSWPEICAKLSADKELTGDAAPLRKVGDPTHRFGTYAYRSADESGQHGLWVGYEEPATAAHKANYVRSKGLGGVALFDLSLDDYQGSCAGERFPILRSIKYKL